MSCILILMVRHFHVRHFPCDPCSDAVCAVIVLWNRAFSHEARRMRNCACGQSGWGQRDGLELEGTRAATFDDLYDRCEARQSISYGCGVRISKIPVRRRSAALVKYAQMCLQGYVLMSRRPLSDSQSMTRRTKTLPTLPISEIRTLTVIANQRTNCDMLPHKTASKPGLENLVFLEKKFLGF